MSARQNPIVVQVEALFWRCDTLEAQLHQARTLGAHLLYSALRQQLAV